MTEERVLGMQKLRIEIDHYEVIPKGYGIGYKPFNKMTCVCYLLPFNLLARIFFWGWRGVVRWSFPNRWEKMLLAEYRAGKTAGYKWGFREGKEKGKVETCEAVGLKPHVLDRVIERIEKEDAEADS